MRRSICDLPPKLVGEKILTRIPITSLRAVRSTCKLWNALCKDWILGKTAATKHQFLGFMTMDSKVCSLRFHLDDEDLVEISINLVDLLDQVEISKVFYCDGLLLCVGKDNSKLIVWNPYLGQTRWITPRTNFHTFDRYALGYDENNRNHKILRFVDEYHLQPHVFEIYDLSSNSWRVLDVDPDWEIASYARGASLEGNTYFFAQEKFPPAEEDGFIYEIEDFLICFDFTTESFGQRLPLPFHSYDDENVTLSCVRQEQLAVLYQPSEDSLDIFDVWITTMIKPNAVSWNKFLRVDIRSLSGLSGFHFQFDLYAASFFVDEEKKIVVVFDLDGYTIPIKTVRYHTAFITGDDRYFKSVNLGEAPNLYTGPVSFGYVPKLYFPPIVCSSSYLPSLVQINQPLKRKGRDD